MRRTTLMALALTVGATALAACNAESSENAIEISGSSTVEPITTAIADRGNIAVNVAAEGTVDGFARFCTGQTAINDASIAISAEEIDTCADNDVEFVELPIGKDAITVVINEDNDFARDMSLAELKAIFEPDSQVTTWADVRSEWPAEKIRLVGRGAGSGTFDFFTHTVMGETGAIRDDYETTDDLTELAQWLAEDANSLGFMGVGNYLGADEEYRGDITNVALDGVMPSLEASQAGEYPLARALYIYVSTQAVEEDSRVAEFVDHYLAEAPEVLPLVRFFPLEDDIYAAVKNRWDERVTGSMADGDPFISDVNELFDN